MFSFNLYPATVLFDFSLSARRCYSQVVVSCLWGVCQAVAGASVLYLQTHTSPYICHWVCRIAPTKYKYIAATITTLSTPLVEFRINLQITQLQDGVVVSATTVKI